MDILDQIDSALTPSSTGNATPVESSTTTFLDPVIPDGTKGWDAAEYGKRPASTSGVETMFSARKMPWHELGVVIPEALRSTDVETILKTAGMDWTVSKRPLKVASSHRFEVRSESGSLMGYAETKDAQAGEGNQIISTWGDFSLPTDKFFGIVRDDTGQVLGVVKRAYTPFQNADALDFVNDLLQSADVTIETAGVLFGGEKVWILANIPRDMTIEGDIHVPYLCISSTHTGEGSVRADLTLMRTECQNSLRWTIRNRELLAALEAAGITNPSPSWTHRHSTNVKAKAADARAMFGFASTFLDAYEAEIKTLMGKVVSPRAFDRMLADFLPMAADLTERQERNVEDKRDKVRAFYEAPSDGGKFKGTGWGALQAFSSFDLWGADLRGGEKTRPTRQIVRLLDGTVEKRTSTVRDRIMAIR